jgi:hypothetical protein
MPKQKRVAISPIAADPGKTAIHEVAHCLLHGDEENTELTRGVKEVEAETVAYIVLSCLGVTAGLEESRGYIQHWRKQSGADQPRLPAVFSAADKILKAGRTAPEPRRPANQSSPSYPSPH